MTSTGGKHGERAKELLARFTGLGEIEHSARCVIVEKISGEIDALVSALEAAEADARQKAEALEVYADGRHWAICRDDLNVPAVCWIGPGAIPETGKYRLPDPATTARAALGRA